MKTYLFVPANRLEFLAKIDQLAADYYVFDLEDSVAKEEQKEAIQNILSNVSRKSDALIRIFWNIDSDNSPDQLIYTFVKKGFKSFLIPKITDGEQLKYLTDRVNRDEIELNILVENPTCLVNLNDILSTYDIKRAFFGSYDYCSELKVKHIPKNYAWPKNYMLHVAKAHDTKAIDVAHLSLEEERFLEDSQEAFQAGFDGKAIIHPKQLDILNNSTLFEEEDLKIALYLKEKIEEKEGVSAIIRYDDNYYEKTHLGYFNKILKLAGYEEINIR